MVVPCYNEEENVEAICAAIAAELTIHASSYEIIFIDNASTDRTRELLAKLCAADVRVKAIFNNRNFGQLRSPTYAVFQATGRAVIAMCADFQDPPAMIGEMIKRWRGGVDIVLGQRRTERATPGIWLSRKLGYAILGAISDYPIITGATGFGIFSRRCVDFLASWNEPEPFFRGMLVESGFSLATIPYDRPQRANGFSKNNFSTLLSFSLSSLAGSAKKILRIPIIFSILGIMLSFILLLAGLFLVVFGRTGGATILFVSLQIGLTNILLFFIGIMGEQVRVISERTRNIPLVSEDRRINFQPVETVNLANNIVNHAG